MQNLIEKFSLEHLNPSPAAINFTKLDHFNGTHIRNLDSEDLTRRLIPYLTHAGYEVDEGILFRAIPIIRERLVTLDDVIPFAGFLFREEIDYDPEDLVGEKLTTSDSLTIAERSLQLLEGLPDITKEQAEPPLRDMVEQLGYSPGQVFGLLRVAVTGQKVSPPLFETMEIVGKDKVLQRIQKAIDLLGNLNKPD
jgi:glutamyl-tRNA synthetase